MLCPYVDLKSRETRLSYFMKNKTYNLISIVVPSYNAEKTIKTFLESVKNQKYKNIEVILVNDGSKDGTEKEIKKFIEANGDIKIILINQKNQGMTQSRNNGASVASGDYLWFLDSDMELLPDSVSECAKLAEQNSLDGIAIPERSKGSGFWAKCRGFEKTINDDDVHKNAVRFIKKSALEKIGMYDTSLTAAEDFEFHVRFVEAGLRFQLLRTSFIYHYEVESVGKMIKKAFNYGKTMPKYIKKRPKESFKQFFIVRPAYFKNWKKFLKEPGAGFGLMLVKFIQYFVAGAGMAVYALKKISCRMSRVRHVRQV